VQITRQPREPVVLDNRLMGGYSYLKFPLKRKLFRASIFNMLFEVRLFTIYWAAMMRSVEQATSESAVCLFTNNLHRASPVTDAIYLVK